MCGSDNVMQQGGMLFLRRMITGRAHRQVVRYSLIHALTRQCFCSMQ